MRTSATPPPPRHPRTLYVQTWGGTNTTARALKSIEEEYADTDEWAAIQQRSYDKLVVYIILNQDESYDDYIAKAWQELTVLSDVCNFWHFAYAWQYHPDELNGTLHADWEFANIVDNKDPLMDLYALMSDGKTVEGELDEEQRGWDTYLEANPNYEKYDFISEGDSPSFFYLLDTGLRSLEDPDGDKLTYRWWRYFEADTYDDGVPASGAAKWPPVCGGPATLPFPYKAHLERTCGAAASRVRFATARSCANASIRAGSPVRPSSGY